LTPRLQVLVVPPRVAAIAELVAETTSGKSKTKVSPDLRQFVYPEYQRHRGGGIPRFTPQLPPAVRAENGNPLRVYGSAGLIVKIMGKERLQMVTDRRLVHPA